MLVVVAAVAMVTVPGVIGVNGIQESTQAHESSVSDAHQQDGDAGGSPSEVGKVGLDFMVMSLFLGFLECLDLGISGVGRLSILIGVLCVFVLVDGVLVGDMLDVGHTNAHGCKSENTNGKENATDEHGTHPDAVFNVGFATAHSSAPFGSAAHNFSFNEGPSCL